MTERCSACPGEFHVIPGGGCSPCRVMFIAQNPGKVEEASACRNEYGQVLIGESGRELWQTYCPLASITREEDVWATNCVKCHTHNDRKPTPKEIVACSEKFLKQELEEHRPELVCLLGAVACSLVPGISLLTHHGYPLRANLFGKSYWTIPLFHPAAGLRDTSVMLPLLQDFERLGKILKGDYSCPVDEYPNPEYEDLTGDHERLEFVLSHVNGDRRLARDTEFLGDPGAPNKIPFCSTFTVSPGTGYMIRVVDRDGLRILGRYVSKYPGVLHNALADLDVERTMGLPYNDNYEDTMQLAAHQQDLPQGLKALAWRLCGMTLQDYDDVVMPYSRQAVLEWLEDAFEIAAMTPGVKIVPKKRKIPKTDKAFLKLIDELKGYRTEDRDGYLHYFVEEYCDSPLTKKILHIHKHTSKPVPAEGTAYSAWRAWTEQVVDELDANEVGQITSRIGEMPRASIEQVWRKSPSSAITYASRDADACLRIYPVLKQRAFKYQGRIVAADIDR
jgi:uracil-DNA glycosylase